MNTVVLITLMVGLQGGSVLTKAPFPDMSACKTARAEVLLQESPGLNAICVYDKEKIKPERMFRNFLNSVENMNKYKEKSE